VKGKLGSYDVIRDNPFDEYKVKTKNYRKLFYGLRRDKDVPREVCNFCRSGITGLNIGDVHYDNLPARVDKHYPKLISKLSELLENVF